MAAVTEFGEIADVLMRYLNGNTDFAVLEAALANAQGGGPIVQDLLDRLYHVINHYEIDAELRAEDTDYGAAMLNKLLVIARSLASDSTIDVGRSIDAFWAIRV